MESLRAWYDWSVNYDTEASEESRAEEVEYFAKAFEMLKPQSHDEAFHYLTILENAFVKNWLIINEYKKKSINVRKDPAPFLNLIVSSCY